MRPLRERLPYVIVILTVAINSLGIGLILPVMPSLLLEMGVPDLSEAAAIGGMLSLVFAAMQFLFAPLLGRLSDRYGRRVVLITSLVAVGIDYLLLAVAGSLWLFFAARIISGIGSATFSVANAILGGSQPARKTCSDVWTDWRSLWSWVCPGPRHRRLSRRAWPPSALSCGGRPGPVERRSGLSDTARNAEA